MHQHREPGSLYSGQISLSGCIQALVTPPTTTCASSTLTVDDIKRLHEALYEHEGSCEDYARATGPYYLSPKQYARMFHTARMAHLYAAYPLLEQQHRRRLLRKCHLRALIARRRAAMRRLARREVPIGARLPRLFDEVCR